MHRRPQNDVVRHHTRFQRPQNQLTVEEMRKTDCPVSLLYDRKHITLRGPNCRYRHDMFKWEGVKDNRVGLVSDSICKRIREIPHMSTQAVPGLTLSEALTKMTNGTINIHGFEALVLFLGTNNLGERPMVIARQMHQIVRFLQRTCPNTKIGICRIIPRSGDPRSKIEGDPSQNIIGDRQKVNEQYKAICKRNRLVFLDTYKGVCTRGHFDQMLYANDLIHLNWDGILWMREYMTGAAATMIDC